MKAVDSWENCTSAWTYVLHIILGDNKLKAKYYIYDKYKNYEHVLSGKLISASIWLFNTWTKKQKMEHLKGLGMILIFTFFNEKI